MVLWSMAHVRADRWRFQRAVHGLVPIGAGLAVALVLSQLHMSHVAGHRQFSVRAEAVRDYQQCILCCVRIL